MTQSFNQFQEISKQVVDGAIQASSKVSTGLQAIAVENADFAKQSFEKSSRALEKIIGSKTLPNAMEAHAEFARGAYEDFIAQSKKISDLYVDLAKQAFKPFEGAVANATNSMANAGNNLANAAKNANNGRAAA